MLGHGHDAGVLDALRLRDAHLADEEVILAHGVTTAVPARIALYIELQAEMPVRARGDLFLAQDAPVFIGGRRIPGRGEKLGVGERRGLQRRARHPGGAVVLHDPGNAQARDAVVTGNGDGAFFLKGHGADDRFHDRVDLFLGDGIDEFPGILVREARAAGLVHGIGGVVLDAAKPVSPSAGEHGQGVLVHVVVRTLRLAGGKGRNTQGKDHSKQDQQGKDFFHDRGSSRIVFDSV